MSRFDFIVIGAGGMGSAAASALARRGRKVLALEQFDLGHALGSSHGHSRVIRTAYYEHPAYVPLCHRSFQLWRELEARTGRRLLTPSGCLSIGQPQSELISGVASAAAEHNLKVERLDSAQLRQRFPAFRFSDDYVGLLEYDAGFLAVEECVRAQLDDAIAHGAEVRDREPVIRWQSNERGVEVETSKGRYAAAKLVITAGPWSQNFLRSAGVNLTVMRQVLLWFQPKQVATFQAGNFPIFLADTPDGCFYSVPVFDERGLKVAQHYGAPELGSLDDVSRTLTELDEEPTRRFIREHLPLADGPLLHGTVCLYTMSPDRHFVIDFLPRHRNVVFAAGFSGHGFKFAPVIGELLAEMSEGKSSSLPLFELSRFA